MSVQYKTVIKEIAIGNLSIAIEVITNMDELFTELVSRADDDPEVMDERIPYWTELWPASIVLARFLEKNPCLIEGKKIIELGCGLGLSGIVAGKLGGNVLLTDYQQKALDFAEANWNRNNSIPARTKILDWRHGDLKEKFDVILAADVAYESKMFKPLVKTVVRLLAPGGCILITEPNRRFANDFIDELKKKNFSITTDTVKLEMEGITHTVHMHNGVKGEE
jgi:predicted nicotinamide N-methyase